jgi:hypothetical protein
VEPGVINNEWRKMMKVYVATRYEDKAEAARWIQHVRDLGVEVTHDWTAVEEAGADPVLRRSYACADMEGVRDADVVWILAPEEGGRGCWTELGMALALHKYVVVSGPGVRKNIFDTLASITTPSHLEGFEFVQGFKRLLAMEQEEPEKDSESTVSEQPERTRQERPAAGRVVAIADDSVDVDCVDCVNYVDPFTFPVLTTDSAERKRLPIFGGVVDYFPNALAEVARISLEGNDKHNPGQPLGWDRSKSLDHAECVMRHLIDHRTLTDGRYKDAAELAWRALALLQTLLESQGAPRSRGSR